MIELNLFYLYFLFNSIKLFYSYPESRQFGLVWVDDFAVIVSIIHRICCGEYVV
ncbi:hypothetical protein AO367_0711 [Moraxella catarrhalis]|nr:hypothetical protein AO367_0711 [Moraxella catarrhalis]